MEKKKLTLKKTKISKLNANILGRDSKEQIKGGGGGVVNTSTHPMPEGGAASGQGYWNHASYDSAGNAYHDTTCYYECVS